MIEKIPARTKIIIAIVAFSLLSFIIFCLCISIIALSTDNETEKTSRGDSEQIENKDNENSTDTNEDKEQINYSERFINGEKIDLVDNKIPSEYLNTQTSLLVIDVVDGDTIKVKNELEEVITIRLIGIDTPEVSGTYECYGNEATKYLEDLILNKKVFLLSDNSQDNKDKYDRLLRYIILEDGLIVNGELVNLGYAKEYTYNKDYNYKTEFNNYEKYAQDNSLGLWGFACECSSKVNTESKRSCSSCNTSTVEYFNYDCSTYTKSLTDNSCSNLCPVPEPQPVPQPSPVPQTNPQPTPQPTPTPAPVPPQSGGYVCNCSKTCPNLSCDEAQYQLNTCGCYQRDNDNDGFACDSKCQ